MAFALADNKIGTPDASAVVTSGNLGTPGIGDLPSVTLETQLGTIRDFVDTTTYGPAKMIYLQVPVSTTVTAGLLYQFDKDYVVTVVPAGSSSKNTAVAVVAAINSVSSNSSSVQYTWFLIQGITAVLKTAVTVTPQSAIYMSATAGRFYVTASAGKGVLGARTQNTATVTSTTSSVNVYLNFSAMEGA